MPEAQAVPAHGFASDRAATTTKHCCLVDGVIVVVVGGERHAVEGLRPRCHLRLVGHLATLAADGPELLHLARDQEEVGPAVSVAQVLGAPMELLGGLGRDVGGVGEQREELRDLRLLVVAGLGGEVREVGGEVARRRVGDADLGQLEVGPLVLERHARDAAGRIWRSLLADDAQDVSCKRVAAALVVLEVDARQRLAGLRVVSGVVRRRSNGQSRMENRSAGGVVTVAVLGDNVVDATLHQVVQHMAAEVGDDGRVAAIERRLGLALLGGVARMGALEVNVVDVSRELGSGGREDASWAFAGEVLLIGAEVVGLGHESRVECGQEHLGELVAALARPRRAQRVPPGVVGSGGRSHLQHAQAGSSRSGPAQVLSAHGPCG